MCWMIVSEMKQLSIIKLVSLTDDIEPDCIAEGWGCGYLAFVLPGVAVLDVMDLQKPVVGSLLVNGLEAVVTGVGEPAYCQQVQVTGPNPRNLKENLKNWYQVWWQKDGIILHDKKIK